MTAATRARPTRVRHGLAGDADLVAATRSGDGEAFGELFRRHAGAVAMAVGDHVSDSEQRRDLVQEAFTRALARLDALRDPGRFRPWVLQIARYAAIDALRGRRGARHEPLDEELAGPADRDDPASLAELRQLAAALVAGVGRLAERDATALALAVHLELSPAEIAAALGVTPGNAKVIVHRARRRLRDAITEPAMAPVAA
jgi:RNA polymerase sigma-70 factor (ECF subfamily)